MLAVGALARTLPEGDWHFAEAPADAELAALALAMGGYAFTRYGKKPGKAIRFAMPPDVAGAAGRLAEGVTLARHCAKYLAEAERRIEVLAKDETGATTTRPFVWEGDDSQ